jgi:4-amino-4-deoxychorismate lyase
MTRALQILVDGAPCEPGWPLDRALQFGDGLFETMLVRNGRICFEALHRARLAQGCDRLAINADGAAIWQQAGELAAAHGEVLLRLQLSRGTATARGYAATGSERARLILIAYPIPSPDELPPVVRAVTLPDVLGENPQLAGLKHCNRLEQVLARRSLQATQAFEGLMASSSGLLISGTMSNVFVQLEGELVTPALDRCGIAGVMRRVVLREAELAGMPVRVAKLPMSVLDHCSGLALTNVRLGLLAVHSINDRRLAAGLPLRNLAHRVAALDA